MPNHQNQQHQQEEEEEMMINYRRFRWYEVLLGLVAAVVAVLAIAVLVKAVMVMRPRSEPYLFQIRVIHGVVPVKLVPPLPLPPTSILLYFHMGASNPITNRPSNLSFTSIAITFNNFNTSTPKSLEFRVDDIVGLMPGNAADAYSTFKSDNPAVDLGNYFFEELKTGQDTFVNIRLYFNLITEFLPFNSTVDDRPAPVPPPTRAFVIYTCYDVFLSLVPELMDTSRNIGNNDIPCTYTSSNQY